MTSKDAMGAMAIERPPGITSLFEAAAHGHNHVCNVMGVVGETWDAKEPQLPYARDWQTKFYIRDQSEQVKGLSVKYFAPLQSGLPKVAPGDIILLRDLKIIPYRMEWGGLSNRDTNFVVFPRNSICDPGFRHQYAVHDRMLPHVKNSSMTLAPTMHEQQWAISLKSLVSIDNLASKGTIATTESNRQVLHAQISNVPETNTRLQRKYLGRFSPLERVTAENFYDFVVVVVKKFQSPYGFLELYVTDYTENSQFRQYEKPADGYSEDWPGPLGKFTLRIDVMAPHAGWVYQNVREDEIVFLTNVRIKTNRNGDGGLEGNIFPDRVYPNRIQVREARENDPGLEELLGRQRLYKTRSMGAFLSGNVKDKGESKGKKKKSRNKKKQTENQPTETVQSEGTPLESKAERVMHTPERALNQTDIHGETPKRIPHKTGLAQSVLCQHPYVPLSSYTSLVHGDLRVNQTPKKRITYTLPFINVKHRVHLRCIDYYPHDLRSFARSTINPRNSVWHEWMFFLVVVAGDAKESETRPIHIEVSGAEADDLLGLTPADLHEPTAARTLATLRNTMFLLWGDLEERKSEYMAGNPDVITDGDWSCMTAGVVPDNRPFEACVEEYGVRLERGENQMEVDGNENEDESMGWSKVWKLFGTRIDTGDHNAGVGKA